MDLEPENKQNNGINTVKSLDLAIGAGEIGDVLASHWIDQRGENRTRLISSTVEESSTEIGCSGGPKVLSVYMGCMVKSIVGTDAIVRRRSIRAVCWPWSRTVASRVSRRPFIVSS